MGRREHLGGYRNDQGSRHCRYNSNNQTPASPEKHTLAVASSRVPARRSSNRGNCMQYVQYVDNLCLISYNGCFAIATLYAPSSLRVDYAKTAVVVFPPQTDQSSYCTAVVHTYIVYHHPTFIVLSYYIFNISCVVSCRVSCLIVCRLFPVLS